MSAPRPNPYAAPGALAAPADDGEAPPVVAPFARAATLSIVFAPIAGFAVGAVRAEQFAFGLGRFGGLEYVPRVVALMATRAAGPGVAMTVTCLALNVVLHRIGKRTPGVVVHDRRTYWLGAAVLAGSVLATAALLLGAAFVSTAFYAQTFEAFAAGCREAVLLSDVGHGAAVAAADAGLVMLVVPLVAEPMARWKRGLLLKLIATYGAVLALEILEGYVAAFVAA